MFAEHLTEHPLPVIVERHHLTNMKMQAIKQTASSDQHMKLLLVDKYYLQMCLKHAWVLYSSPIVLYSFGFMVTFLAIWSNHVTYLHNIIIPWEI